MSRIIVATWNAEGMFVAGSLTRRGTPEQAISVLRELDADVVGVPEFGVIDRTTEATRAAITAMGYTLLTTTHNDSRHPGYGSALLSRLPVERQELYALGDDFRQALAATVRTVNGKEIRICSLYLDDRTNASRVREMSHAIEALMRRDMPTIIMGDFNTMSATSMLARFLRLPVMSLVECLTRGHLQSIIARLRMMAHGTALRILHERTNLHDLDTKHHLTISAKQAGFEWLPSIRLAKIDWMFGSPEFTTISYRVWRDVGSDHRPIRAELDY